ncbi:hypothetical protein TNCV_326101 [Trichonephila clavipes]|nr:hypothetical protein TNCV_326101 [Trichonephila clavipes]
MLKEIGSVSDLPRRGRPSSVLGLFGQILRGGKEDQKDSYLLRVTHGWKYFRSVQGCVVHKRIGGNRHALLQSLEQLSHAWENRTFYEYRAGRHAPDLRIDRRDYGCTNSTKIASRKRVGCEITPLMAPKIPQEDYLKDSIKLRHKALGPLESWTPLRCGRGFVTPLLHRNNATD